MYSIAGTYAVKLVASSLSNCKDSITKTVTVFSKPIANFTVSNACAGSNAVFNNTSTGGATYNWDLGDGTSSGFFNPAKNYSVAGSYGIILTVVSSQGCMDKATKSVNIFTLPVSSFNVQNNCFRVATTFSNNSIGGNTYLWNFGDNSFTSPSPSPAKTYSKEGTYNVTLLVTSIDGCTHSSTKPVTIHTLPKPNFTTKDGCIGVQTDFTNMSSFPSGGGNYLWRFGDGKTSTQDNPSYTYGLATTYDAGLIAISSFGCKDSAFRAITIFDKPTPSFTAADVCDGKAMNFINNSTGAVSHSWDFGDGTKNNSSNPSHTYLGPNIYKVTLTSTSSNNCSDVTTGNVTVKANPELVFFTSDHCHGSQTAFTNLSVGAASFTWKFGDGDSSKFTQASHTYLTAGNYNVKLIGMSAKGCRVEQTKAIKVFPKPVPTFSAPTVCAGLITPFTNTSTGASNYLWNFGDGGGSSTANNPSYQYMNAGNYKVILTTISSDNCKEELTKTITVAPLPIPIFLVQDICTGVEVKPSNLSQGPITSQKWNFGDGNTDSSHSPSHSYAAAGIYTIKLKVNSGLGCSDSTSKTVLIYTKPVIKISPDVTVNKGYSVQLLASGGTDYLWSPGESLNDPLIANPIATPKQETRYTVRVMNAFGCFDTASVNVSLVENFALEPYNLFTPNSNGQNDFWKIKGIEFYPKAKVMVFDQWGRIIIDQENYKNDWDGTLKGKPLPDGTYYYTITLLDSERQYKGTVNILRN